MKKVIRLTESDLHNIIKKSVQKVLNEHEGWKEEDWNSNYPYEDDDYEDDDPFTKWKEDKEAEMMR